MRSAVVVLAVFTCARADRIIGVEVIDLVVPLVTVLLATAIGEAGRAAIVPVLEDAVGNGDA